MTRRLHVVAELEADRGQFRERAVVDLEGGPGLWKAAQRHEGLTRGGVVQDRMAVRERAAAHILAGQADRCAISQYAPERQFLGGGPVDRPLVGVVQRVPALLPRAVELLVDREAPRPCHQAFVDGAKPFKGHGGVHPRGGSSRSRVGHGRHEVLFGLERGQRLLERGEVPLHQRVGFDREAVALRRQRAREEVADGGMCGHALVEQGLREGGLVALVVSVAPVPDQVDEEVTAEALTIGPGQPCRLDAGDRVVCIHMDDRDLEAAGQAAGVAGAVGLGGSRGEAELVVRDDVDRAAGVVAREAREVEGLGVNRRGVGQEALVELLDVAGVDALKLLRTHSLIMVPHR